jgi:hypothetical protein
MRTRTPPEPDPAEGDRLLLTYEEVRQALGNRRAHLLVGNGFSIACDPVFSYSSLFEAAVNRGLSDRAQALFERLGSNNFEGVMRLLDDADWVARIYELIGASDHSGLQEDVEVIKATLVETIASSHLEHSGLVSDAKKQAALAFLGGYHSVFTTNYDLLLYWTVMSAAGTPMFEDGFRSDPDDRDETSLVFGQRIGDKPGLYYLHGALHLFLEGGNLRKHSWCRTGVRLIEQVREGLANQRYPVFVAEGAAEKKLEQIQRVGYLWYCLDKLRRIERPLVVFGHSLGSSDNHIWDAIAENRKLATVYVALHGGLDSDSGQAIRSAARQMQVRRLKFHAREPLEVVYFDSRTANVWGSTADPGMSA